VLHSIILGLVFVRNITKQEIDAFYLAVQFVAYAAFQDPGGVTIQLTVLLHESVLDNYGA
jgi:hypothetical protein